MKTLRTAGLLTLALLAACREAQPALGWDGVGGVPWGTPIADARQQLGQPLEVDATAGTNCGYTSATIDGHRVDMMVADGRLVRADVTADSTILAPGGGHVGSTAADIRDAFGSRIRRRPHKYTEGQYLTIVVPDDTVRRVVFEIEQDRVSEWRIGLFPEVEYVEGCS